MKNKTGFQNILLQWPFLFFLSTKSIGWSDWYNFLLLKLLIGFKLQKQRGFSISLFLTTLLPHKMLGSLTRDSSCMLYSLGSRTVSEDKALGMVTIQHLSNRHFGWPGRLKRDDVCRHLRSIQHAECPLRLAPMLPPLLLLRPHHLYSLFHMRLVKRFHAFKNKH